MGGVYARSELSRSVQREVWRNIRERRGLGAVRLQMHIQALLKDRKALEEYLNGGR